MVVGLEAVGDGGATDKQVLSRELPGVLRALQRHVLCDVSEVCGSLQSFMLLCLSLSMASSLEFLIVILEFLWR